MLSLLSIALGGACGALSRHGVNVMATNILNVAFPLGTLAVNIIGSLIMGILIAVFALWFDPPQPVKSFLIVGFLGSFTTFSTFSLDTMLMFNKGEYGHVFLYMATSVILSLAAIFIGNWLTIKLLTNVITNV